MGGAQAPASLYLSRVTIAEIRYGIERLPSDLSPQRLETWLDNELRPWFADRLLVRRRDFSPASSYQGGAPATSLPRTRANWRSDRRQNIRADRRYRCISACVGCAAKSPCAILFLMSTNSCTPNISLPRSVGLRVIRLNISLQCSNIYSTVEVHLAWGPAAKLRVCYATACRSRYLTIASHPLQ
jgi:hypothetical protein